MWRNRNLLGPARRLIKYFKINNIQENYKFIWLETEKHTHTLGKTGLNHNAILYSTRVVIITFPKICINSNNQVIPHQMGSAACINQWHYQRPIWAGLFYWFILKFLLMRKLRLGEARTHVKKLWRTTNLSEDLQWNLRLPAGEFDYSKVLIGLPLFILIDPHCLAITSSSP